MYNVFVDKPTTFECEVQIKNASLKGSIARLILESEDVNLVFNGKIEGDKCVVPIRRLKNILSENSRGNISLEIVVEDTLFKPWNDTFSVQENTSVKVNVNEQTQHSNRPIVEIKSPIIKSLPPKKSINIITPKKEIAYLCEKFGIRKNNIKKKHKDFIQILKEYFKINTEYNNHTRRILNGIGEFLR